jgi:hypothetical protein
LVRSVYSVFSWWGFLLVKSGLVRQCCFRWEMFLFCFTSVQGSVLVLGWSKTTTSHSKIVNGVVWVSSRSFGWDCLWGIILLPLFCCVLVLAICTELMWLFVVLFYWLRFFHRLFFSLFDTTVPYIFYLGDLSINKI